MSKTKKRWFGAIVVIVVIFSVALWSYEKDKGIPYQLPFTQSDVESITLYNGSSMEKKELYDAAEIALVTDALLGLHNLGEPDSIVAGYVPFAGIFQLKDGGQFSFKYSQIAPGKGYFSDGKIQVYVSHLDLERLWGELETPSVDSPFVDDLLEYSVIPGM